MEKSLNEDTYEKLKYDIMNFKLVPGDSISAQKIAVRYNVSRTPAREAIVNLEKEGLLKIIPQSGTYVASINCRRFEQEWFVRKSLEVGMVDPVFEHVSNEMLDKMEELNSRLIIMINVMKKFQGLKSIMLFMNLYMKAQENSSLLI